MENCQVKERPIIFSSEMVRAILEGRKTQTRRVIKPQPVWKYPGNYERGHVMSFNRGVWHATVGFGMACESHAFENCPYGKPGDRLWVRETWIPDPTDDDTWDYYCFSDGRIMNLNALPRRYKNPSHVIYKSTWGNLGLKWKKSIHMPRWASRITLEITNVRVERLQDIRLKDIYAEGLNDNIDIVGHKVDKRFFGYYLFKELWNSINDKKYPWESNPWVWVIEFNLLSRSGGENG